MRVPDYNLEPCLGNSMTLVYSDEEINIFGKSKWAFNATWHDTYFNIHRFVIADNPSYSLSKRTIEMDFNGQIRSLHYYFAYACLNHILVNFHIV